MLAINLNDHYNLITVMIKKIQNKSVVGKKSTYGLAFSFRFSFIYIIYKCLFIYNYVKKTTCILAKYRLNLILKELNHELSCYIYAMLDTQAFFNLVYK